MKTHQKSLKIIKSNKNIKSDTSDRLLHVGPIDMSEIITADDGSQQYMGLAGSEEHEHMTRNE